MSVETISFSLDSEKRKAIDEIAAGMNCDRADVLNNAIEAYLETHQWQIEHIQEGLRQADAEEFATDKVGNQLFIGGEESIP